MKSDNQTIVQWERSCTVFIYLFLFPAVCGKDLANVGFFEQNNQYFCPEDFQERFGTKCGICHLFLEGEGINVAGIAYHESCFVCSSCGNPFPPGEKVVLRGKNFICQRCSAMDQEDHSRGQRLEKCAGCGEVIRSDQSLLALEKQWHLWCFTCTKCNSLLAGKYMGRDGKPYCEKDYQADFGVTCAGCGGYIIGKVLQAGEKHYHPECSRCARCHGVFGEGQEMFLQGSEIWHPDCSMAEALNGEEEIYPPPPTDEYFHNGYEASRPSPPTRTSASRITDWKVKYSPQKEEGSYKVEPSSRVQEETPVYQATDYASRSYLSCKTFLRCLLILSVGTSAPSVLSRHLGCGKLRSRWARPDNRESLQNHFINTLRINLIYVILLKDNLNQTAPQPEDYPYGEEFDMEENMPQVFLYKDLVTTNYKLPAGVDKTKLEAYLSEEEFEKVFSRTKDEFYSLPKWKQQARKKEVLLF
ncbi:PREDICTED: actin-binding LIM protein 2-like [Acropora digitifera]|uniref:actin-binding LIM protein 2-like n=1 Tax=Acropora digitifera TaxID=70779 RepID=UPI00077B06CD|nr:PREDICTED: actin-binding LIM protein 2-like [Acropora digitifera]